MVTRRDIERANRGERAPEATLLQKATGRLRVWPSDGVLSRGHTGATRGEMVVVGGSLLGFGIAVIVALFFL